jgi:hypothetical protein
MKNKNEAKNAIDDISKNFKWEISMKEPKKKSIMSESSSEKENNNTKDENTTSNIKSLKVKELWIGNLPQDINEQRIKLLDPKSTKFYIK